MSSDAKCPVTGSQVTALPPDHPKTAGDGSGVCPVTNATVSHHPAHVVHDHPKVPAGATADDCPVLRDAKETNTCPVVGTKTAALPPNHPTPGSTDAQVCPVTNATKAHHVGAIHEHPAVPAGASAKDCPVLATNGVAAAKADAAIAATERCPVTGSTVTSLPPDHPATTNGGVCPVTKATTGHHDLVVHDHPAVPAGASAKDCPVLSAAATTNICPVVGTSAAALPPQHPTAQNGGTCPVTGAKAEHHATVHEHPNVAQADSAAKCPVTGAVAEHHTTVSDASQAQCPVTGQFADGSRPAANLAPQLAAEPVKFTVLGNPFSTFTRTLTMGLHECGVAFDQKPYLPHAAEVKQYNPFGRIPVLLVGHSGQELAMTETESIVRWLDTTAGAASGAGRVLRYKADDLVNNQKLDEFVSIVTSYVFGAVEVGVVKPWLEEPDADLSEGLAKMHDTLAVVERRMHGPYLMGMPTTWADLFLYPILADLKGTKYAAELAKHPKLDAWTDRMAKRRSAVATVDGTLATGARP